MGDLRDALRQLRKAPGFTITAVITLALGIGATTAIFTLVHQVMLKSLPVTKPGELWRIGDKDRCCNWGGYTQGDEGDFALFSWEAYQHFRAHTPEFVDLAALQAGNAQLGVRRVGSLAPVDTPKDEEIKKEMARFQRFSRVRIFGSFAQDGEECPASSTARPVSPSSDGLAANRCATRSRSSCTNTQSSSGKATRSAWTSPTAAFRARERPRGERNRTTSN